MASRFGEERIDILNTLVMMLPGVSVTYYGEEIGMVDSCAEFKEGHNKSATACTPGPNNPWQDVWARSPMQWDKTKNAGFSANDDVWIPVASNYESVNVNVQEGSESSHLGIYKQLLKLRKNKAITDSDIFEIKALGENSFAFKR